jgi:hypothetical protein
MKKAMKVFNKFETPVYEDSISAIERSYKSRDGFLAHETADKQALLILSGGSPLNDKLRKYFLYDHVELISGLFLLAGLYPMDRQSIEREVEGANQSPENEPTSNSIMIHIVKAKYRASVMGEGPYECYFGHIERLDGLSVGWFRRYAETHESFDQNEWWEGNKANSLYMQLQADILREIERRIEKAIELCQIWESGQHPKHTSLQYMVTWAQSKGFTVEWLKWVTEQGYISRENKNTNNSPLSPKEETTYLNIIAGMLEMLTEKKNINQSTVIQTLLERYEGKQGLKQRTLEGKFSDAKRSLNSD